jgi:anti-sigma B factor antagonist
MQVRTVLLEHQVALVQAEGAATGDEGAAALYRAIGKAIDEQRTRLIVDLENVSYLNSTAIGALLRAHVTYTRNHWEYRICGLNERVYTILAITKLNQVLCLKDTLEQARRSLAGSPTPR